MTYYKASCPSWEVSIWIAGSAYHAELICQDWANTEGACVTVTPTTYVYTGGSEKGVRVGFINYPRFPRDAEDAMTQATVLGQLLMLRLGQHSFSVVGPERTDWYSRRPEDLEKLNGSV